MTTPTPEAIEAAEAAVRKYYSAGGWVRTADVAKLAVEAAYPLMEAQAKANALREAAGEIRNHPRLRKTQSAWLYYPESMAAKQKYYLESAEILDDRAATVQGKD